MNQLVAGLIARPHDADELHELEAQVQRQMDGRVQNLRLVREDQGLVLMGQTNSYYMKQLVQEAVRQNSELPIASNRIAVRTLV
jgi:hypothetical protein